MNQRHLLAPSESDSVGVPPTFVQMKEDGTLFTSGWKRPMMKEVKSLLSAEKD